MNADLLKPPATMPIAKLSNLDYAAAAEALGCEVAAVKAFAQIESGLYGSFLPDGRPVALYEASVFSRETQHVFDLSHPNISSMAPMSYGVLSAQYTKLAEAFTLSPAAALMSASWGAFQILGKEYSCCGYPDVYAMVADMRTGVGAHLSAFVRFVQHDPKLTSAIRAKDWKTAALIYNGPKQAKRHYADDLAAAYAAAR